MRLRDGMCARCVCALLLAGLAACLDDGGGGGFDDDGLRDCNSGDLTLRSEGDEPSQATIDVEMAFFEGGVSFSDGPVFVNIPDSVEGLSITVEADALETELRLFEDGEELDIHDTEIGKAKTVNLPFDASSAFEGACLAILPAVEGDIVGEDVEVHITARAEQAADPVFTLNFIVLGETTITDQELEEIADFANAIYEDNGAPSLVVEDIFDEDGPTIVDDEGDELDELRNKAFGDDPFALNVIFLQDFEAEGVLGFAGGIPGPTGVATVASAVVLAVDGHLDADGELQIDVMGSTLAHELAHQLGLFHTTEQSGDSFDPLGDTEQCDLSNDADGDGEISADECEDLDGPNLMFFETSEQTQTELSETQVEVLNAHPLAF